MTNRTLYFVATLLAACIWSSCTQEPPASRVQHQPLPYAVDINKASADELATIPHIGEKLAARIVEYRTQRGPFERAEHLMLVEGIGDSRFRKIRPLVKVE